MEVKMGSMHCEDGEIRGKLEMKMKYEEETELRLGLPGNNISGGYEHEVARKRGFSETVVDLKLNLSSAANTCKDPCPGDADPSDEKKKLKNSNGSNAKMNSLHSKDKATLLSSASATSNDPVKPPAKAQVVGWPPVRSFRKNMMAVQKNSTDEVEKGGASTGFFVKVSMDGAPYLRKVDLKMYKSYQELSEALCKMFSSFTIGSCESQEMKELMSSEKKLMDLLNGSDYVPTYEDKDGDWMLVGDVPWDMFVESCKRLRIMKGTEAIGLAPKAMEKCKSRS